MELAAHWHRCQNLPKKRVTTLLLYRERDDPVKERLANWRTQSRTLGSVEERYTGTLHGRTSKRLATWQIDSYLSHFYCITSCLLAHCLFGRFFLASFPLYSGGSDATLAHPR